MAISTKIIRLPVKLVDGHWELLYGGPIKAKDGTVGELQIDKAHFTDNSFLKVFTEKRRVPVLPQGTELRVALTIKSLFDPTLLPYLLPIGATEYDHTTSLSVDTHFIRIHLAGPTAPQRGKGEREGGLWLLLEGMEPRGIESGIVQLPEAPGLESVDSLNYAFTRLSEVFEPWRKAHTGSVYERVFYCENNGRWYPLKDLRDRALASTERKIIQALWSNVQAQIEGNG